MATWLNRNVIIPVIQSMAVACVVAAALFLTRSATVAGGSCPASVEPYVILGERRLQADDIESARQLAEDSLVEAPRSGCANTLAAATELQFMRRHRRQNDTALANEDRRRCFLYA